MEQRARGVLGEDTSDEFATVHSTIGVRFASCFSFPLYFVVRHQLIWHVLSVASPVRTQRLHTVF